MPYYNRDPKRDRNFDNHPLEVSGSEVWTLFPGLKPFVLNRGLRNVSEFRVQAFGAATSSLMYVVRKFRKMSKRKQTSMPTSPQNQKVGVRANPKPSSWQEFQYGNTNNKNILYKKFDYNSQSPNPDRPEPSNLTTPDP